VVNTAGVAAGPGRDSSAWFRPRGHRLCLLVRAGHGRRPVPSSRAGPPATL